jgi:predicted deacylase
MNPTGFEHRTVSMVYEDGKNLNRVFPGNRNGTMADKIAFTVVEKFIKNCHYHLDLHSGDSSESLVPMVFSVGKAASDVVKTSRMMAEAVNARYLVVSQIDSGGAYNCAGSLGLPSILIERGEKGLWTKQEADLVVCDVKNVLKRIGLLSGDVTGQTLTPMKLAQTAYLPAPNGGLWYPNKTAGDFFKKDQIIGEIRDYFGKLLSAPVFEFDGVVLYQVESLTVLEGENLIAYGGFPEG